MLMDSGQRFMRIVRIYQNVPYFSHYWAPKMAIPFIWTNLNPHPQECFLPKLVEIGFMVIEKKSFKGQSWHRTDRRTLRHIISSHGLPPGELKSQAEKLKISYYLCKRYWCLLNLNTIDNTTPFCDQLGY